MSLFPHLQFVINYSFSQTIFSPATVYQAQSKMFFGLINSSMVSVVVQPMSTISTIVLPIVYWLGLFPLFDHFSCYMCDSPLSIPTTNSFYTSRTPLRCVHVPGESDIILGSDWMSATGATLYNGGSGILNPLQSVIALLPEGHYWSPNEWILKTCSWTNLMRSCT